MIDKKQTLSWLGVSWAIFQKQEINPIYFFFLDVGYKFTLIEQSTVFFRKTPQGAFEIKNKLAIFTPLKLSPPS